MIAALVTVLVTGTVAAGGFDAVIENAKAILGYFSLNAPRNADGGRQRRAAGGKRRAALRGARRLRGAFHDFHGLLGLGFGMPQVLLRFYGDPPPQGA